MNTDLAYTVQSVACSKYGLPYNNSAAKYFESCSDSKLVPLANKIVHNVFDVKLKAKPEKYTGYDRDPITKKLLPYNFILTDKRTLSLRVNKSNSMVAPDDIGQAGFVQLNEYFSDVLGRPIQSKQDIKELIFYHISEIIDDFLERAFKADILVLVRSIRGQIETDVFENVTKDDFSFDPKKFSFTRDISRWVESNTIKYDGISIAEAQVHKNRLFKFRFRFKNLKSFIDKGKKTNETLGVSGEKAIIDLFGLQKEEPKSFSKRADPLLVKQLTPVISSAFKELPKAIHYTGNKKGDHGKFSKCSYDFVLDGNKTLSVKTNFNRYVCPPDVGQPCAEVFVKYFKDVLHIRNVNPEIFKSKVYEDADLMLKIYSDYLFDSDYLLWLYYSNGRFNYTIFKKNAAKAIDWDKKKITFSKQNLKDWNECNSVRYEGMNIGEFQVHNHRDCYKFRFNFANLKKIIDENPED